MTSIRTMTLQQRANEAEKLERDFGEEGRGKGE